MSKNPEVFETAFEKYTVTSVIGEGGAGRVFEARDANGRIFAVKCLRPELISSDKRKRFKNEIDFCSRHEHPNLIRVLDSGIVEWGGRKTMFYVMPKFTATLRTLIGAHIASKDILRFFGQILDGVEAAHKLGVIHRDLKPENVLFDPQNGLCVVADFGIARFEEDLLITLVETKKSDKLLNVAYSAPEQRVRGGTVDHRADIFSLGLILNEMFTGTVPEGVGHPTIEGVSPDQAYLDAVVEKMRQQNPPARPQSIEEIKKELIGRRNEFIALQELDIKKRQVIAAHEPGRVQELQITDALWDNQTLHISLNRAPEPGFIQRIREAIGTGGFLMDLHPNAYNFTGEHVSIGVEERYAQNAINQLKGAIPRAIDTFQIDIERAAKEKERKLREQLQQEVEAADAKARVNKSLKF